MNYKEESLKLHGEWGGKIEVVGRIPLKTKEDLSLAYTPGVAAPCLAINKDIDKSFTLTRRGNLIAVVTDGTAVLGLGDIGAEAGMPVMEGKCLIFKELGGVDAFPLCIRSKDVDEIVRTVYLLSGSFGGINLEDISAPRCFEIERRLKEICDIPIFHDDQHGTAIVTCAALINALKLANKDIGAVRIVINGAGSAGIAVCRLLMAVGANNIVMCDSKGVIHRGRAGQNSEKEEIARLTNPTNITGSLADAMKGSDVFIGLSVADCVSLEMAKSMNERAILFPMANPDPEINYDLAIASGAFIVGTGRSDYPNQINNALVFPGVFRGALDVRAREITESMKIAAAYAIAEYVSDLSPTNIVPNPLDKGVHRAVGEAVRAAWIKGGRK